MNGLKINGEKFGYCLVKLFNYNVNNKNNFIGKGEYFMNQYNERWKKTIPGLIGGEINNIRGGIGWEFIKNYNKAVRVKKSLFFPYFAFFNKYDKKSFAYNGQAGQSEELNNPAPCFTEKGTYYYFKRKINIWNDFPKLNYGNSPSNCPCLIEHMTKYVHLMKIFQNVLNVAMSFVLKQ